MERTDSTGTNTVLDVEKTLSTLLEGLYAQLEMIRRIRKRLFRYIYSRDNSQQRLKNEVVGPR